MTVLHRGRVWRKYKEAPVVKVNNWDIDDVEEMGTHRDKTSSNCLIQTLKARTTFLC